MQAELLAERPDLEIQILGVNEVGYESGNAAIISGRSLPWLQDTPEADVWGLWEVTWRDVVVLDGENRVHAIYNLTDHDLAEPGNYDALKSMLIEAAGG